LRSLTCRHGCILPILHTSRSCAYCLGDVSEQNRQPLRRGEKNLRNRNSTMDIARAFWQTVISSWRNGGDSVRYTRCCRLFFISGGGGDSHSKLSAATISPKCPLSVASHYCLDVASDTKLSASVDGFGCSNVTT